MLNYLHTINKNKIKTNIFCCLFVEINIHLHTFKVIQKRFTHNNPNGALVLHKNSNRKFSHI